MEKILNSSVKLVPKRIVVEKIEILKLPKVYFIYGKSQYIYVDLVKVKDDKLFKDLKSK